MMIASSISAHAPTLDQSIAPAPPEVVASAATACDVCEHPLENHDAIARRFCTATISNAITRGCICRLP